MSNQKLPPVEYHICQIVGHGYRFIPAFTRSVSRMKKDILSGYLVGVVTIWNNDLRTRHVDINREAHPDDRVYDLKELPSSSDQDRMIKRLQDEYPMVERVLILEWELQKGRAYPRPVLAPVGFQIPTVTKFSWPENSDPAPTQEPSAEPLSVSLGDIVKEGRKQKRRKDEKQDEAQDEA